MIPSGRLLLTREGWYYLVVVGLIVGAAMLRGVNLILLLGGLLLGPLVLSLWALWRSVRGLRASRRLPQGICAGDLLVVTVTLSKPNRGWGAWSVVVEDSIQRDSAQQSKSRWRPAVYQTLLVYPRLGRLKRTWAARRREVFAGMHRRELRAGSEGDFFGTRCWQPGDTRRQIHWRATARRGELVVCQREQPRHRDVTLVLALWRPRRPSVEQEQAVERAVSFAATVVSDLCRQGGAKVHLATFDREADWLGGPASPAMLKDLMERLAVVEARRDDHLEELWSNRPTIRRDVWLGRCAGSTPQDENWIGSSTGNRPGRPRGHWKNKRIQGPPGRCTNGESKVEHSAGQPWAEPASGTFERMTCRGFLRPRAPAALNCALGARKRFVCRSLPFVSTVTQACIWSACCKST